MRHVRGTRPEVSWFFVRGGQKEQRHGSGNREYCSEKQHLGRLQRKGLRNSSECFGFRGGMAKDFLEELPDSL